MSNNSFKIKNGLTLTPTDPSTLTNPQAGDLVCDSTDNNKIKRYDDISATWTELGSGGGGLDTYYTEDMEAGVASFTTGNNATFLNGGVLAGTLAVETTSPISGTRSLKYTQAAGSLNDYFASDIIDIDLKQQNNDSGMTLYFEYDGNDNDMRFVVWDVTNNQRLSSEAAFVKKTGKAQRYSLSFYVPTSCTQIRWGAQVIAVNSGKVLVVDDVEMSTDPFMEGELIQLTDWQSFTPIGSWTTNTTYTGKYRRVGDSAEIMIQATFSGTPGPQPTLVFNIGSIGAVDLNKSTIAAWRVGSGNLLDSSIGSRTAVHGYVTASTAISMYYSTTNAGVNPVTLNDVTAITSAGPITIEAGDNITISFSVPILGWTSSTPHVLTPSDTFSTDTSPLTWAAPAQYDLNTLANAPIGTYITFQYAQNTNTRTQCTTRPTQADADMNVNGIQIFTRAYNAASTAASPAAIAIQIGKGLKGTSLGLYKSAGKVISGSTDSLYQGAAQAGISIKDYNETSGVLTIDTGCNHSSAATTAYYIFSDTTFQNNGYLTINASKSAALTAVPTPLVAYLKDVKPSGTAGGTFTAGSWQTRTLNTLEGDTSFVSLSANQFTLQPGRYEIEASAPGYNVNSHQSKIRNVTDSVDIIIGTSEYSSSPSGTEAATRSNCTGTITITSPKVLELQHQCHVTKAGDGYGVATPFGLGEVFSVVKITKVG